MFDYELFTSDPGDYLTLVLERGKVSVWLNHQWQPVSGAFAFQPGPMQADSLKLRVERKASFSFSTVDSYSVYPYDDAPTSPSAWFGLAPGLEPDMGDSRSSAWTIGKVDALTGVSWNEGIVGSSTAPGIYITETIGGDDVSDYAKFSITRVTTVKVETDGAIAQLLNARGMVVTDSSDGYQSTLIAQLRRGTYYLGFSTESSTSELFTAVVSVI